MMKSYLMRYKLPHTERAGPVGKASPAQQENVFKTFYKVTTLQKKYFFAKRI